MSRFLLDMDHVTLIEIANPLVVSRLLSCAPGDVAISPINIEEVFRGRMAAVASATNGEERIRFYSRLARSLETLGSLNLVAYDESAEKRFMDLKGLKLRLGTQDLKIASIALANSLIVVTRNRRDFGRIPGLTIEDWSAP